MAIILILCSNIMAKKNISKALPVIILIKMLKLGMLGLCNTNKAKSLKQKFQPIFMEIPQFSTL